MELMEGLLSRRSVRQYTDQKVAAADITDIVKAGMYAPSARNQQVWEFVVITDKDKLISSATACRRHPWPKRLRLPLPSARIWIVRRLPNIGNKTAPPPCKTCCLPAMPKGSDPFGSACTRMKNAKMLSKKSAIFPKT